MKFSLTTVVAVAALMADSASAHYFFEKMVVNGVASADYMRSSTQGYQPQSNSIMTSNTFRCNTGAKAAAKTATVAAGSEVGFQMNFGAKIQHPGPLQIWMSKASGDLSSYDGSGDWFKVYESGPTKFPLTGAAEEWGVYNKNIITFTVPKDLAAGDYLVRPEHLALHKPSGTEFYFNCGQMKVTGSGTKVPTATVKFPGVYDSNTAGLSPNERFSLYQNAKSYPMPGTTLVTRELSLPMSRITRGMREETKQE
ncbi:putative endo-beta-1,4-glucanase D [Colletotrichum sp. SAR11_59]|nr:putative endo-beta-1,4-glucanase D [Colletotrichum sp. SAR11_59]